jgi:hypothetical protein
MLNKVCSLVFLGAISLAVIAQPVFGSKAGYSSICVEEQSTGFNWQNKRWVQTNFKEDTYIVSRIPLEKYQSTLEARANKIYLCSDKSKENSEFEKTAFVNECYSVTKIGQKPTLLDSNMCTEIWESKRLITVQCDKHSSKLTFQPTGNFIKQPWHSDLRSDEQNKDSLALSVGKCTSIQ